MISHQFSSFCQWSLASAEAAATICRHPNQKPPIFRNTLGYLTHHLRGNPSPALTCQLQEKDERSSFFSIDLRESAAINYPNNELAISLFASVSRLSSAAAAAAVRSLFIRGGGSTRWRERTKRRQDGRTRRSPPPAHPCANYCPRRVDGW